MYENGFKYQLNLNLFNIIQAHFFHSLKRLFNIICKLYNEKHYQKQHILNSFRRTIAIYFELSFDKSAPLQKI